MKRVSLVLSIVFASALVICDLSALPAQGQRPGRGFSAMGQGPRGGGGMIVRLNRALSKAGATELTEVQVDQITALIESARESRPGPDGAFHDSALMGSYADAIVSGDLETAKNIAEQIAAEVAVRSCEHLQARAEFQYEVLNVLEQGGQLPVLKEQVGSQGLLKLLSPQRGRFGGGPGGKGFKAGHGRNAPPN